MQKTTNSHSALFLLRAAVACALFCFAILLGVFSIVSFASTPSSGTLNSASGPVTYMAGPFVQPNQSPLGLGQLDTGPRCNSTTFPCDSFDLTVTLPAGYTGTNCNAAVKVTLSWVDAGTGQSDYDLYIYEGVVGNLGGNTPADFQSTSSGYRPEIATVAPLKDGTTHYTIKIVPFQPTGETVNVKVELLPGSGGCGTPGFGGADKTKANSPRYITFNAPPGSSAEVSNGEFNIGFNPFTHRIMVMNAGPVWRLTPPEILTPAKPECCEALWEDKSPATTDILALDPILWTDQKTGRTFVSNNTTGATFEYAYSDNDGDPGGLTPLGWTELALAVPNGGADHETIGSGPYPAALSALTTPINHGQPVYYCSQDIVGPAACYRSDTQGASWGPAVLAYTGQGSGSCGGLHGHVHVAPDGTAWLPVNQCHGLQGGVFSTDAGTTWTTFRVPNAFSQAQGADPSIAIDANNKIYYSYVKNEPVAASNPPEGHAHVAVGNRSGTTINWVNDIDIGATHGVKNAAEIEAVGGDAGRAAVGFLGSDRPGDYQALHFPGKWYAFISTTYNGGATWTTVNATPNDPVQSMAGIWQQGGSKTQRNLLDFNEITVDDKGRVLYGYSDGCVTAGCIAGTAPNDFVAFMRVARQSGGKGLYARFDVAEPTKPKAPCLSGSRDAFGAHLSWKAPDNGGADIKSYRIFRGTTPGGEGTNPIATTSGSVLKLDDTSALSSVPLYYYIVKAVNNKGVSVASNEIAVPVVVPPPPQNPCTAPGVTLLTDPAGDSLSPEPGTDMLAASVAQQNGNLVFTINTDPSLANQHPIGSAWYLAMKIPGATAGTFRYTGVRMEFGAAGPSFFSYTPGPNSGGGIDGRFVDAEQPADASSSYNASTGQIIIVVKPSDLGLATGSTIVGFVAGSSQTTDPTNSLAGATEVWDSMPDSLTFTNNYTIVGTCP